MCYHISQTIADPEVFYNDFEVDYIEALEAMPVYYHLNGFKRDKVMIITQDEPNQIQLATWSVAPPFIEDPTIYWKKVAGGSLNTRIESLFETNTPYWKKHAILKKKCLIIVDGLFKIYDNNGRKHTIYTKSKNKEPFTLLGYYTEQYGYLTCSILTSTSDRFFDFHKRMPFTIEAQDKNFYLNHINTTEDYTQFIKTFKSIPFLEKQEVTMKIFNSSFDTNNKECLLKISNLEL